MPARLGSAEGSPTDPWMATMVVGLQPSETLSFCSVVLPSPSHLWGKALHYLDKMPEEEESGLLGSHSSEPGGWVPREVTLLTP